jgi:hypothetical protein
MTAADQPELINTAAQVIAQGMEQAQQHSQAAAANPILARRLPAERSIINRATGRLEL